MPKLRYSDASKVDLKEIAANIAKDKPKAARLWVAKLREKCRMLVRHPEVGDDRADLGEGIRSTYLGSAIRSVQLVPSTFPRGSYAVNSQRSSGDRRNRTIVDG